VHLRHAVKDVFPNKRLKITEDTTLGYKIGIIFLMVVAVGGCIATAIVIPPSAPFLIAGGETLGGSTLIAGAVEASTFTTRSAVL